MKILFFFPHGLGECVRCESQRWLGLLEKGARRRLAGGVRFPFLGTSDASVATFSSSTRIIFVPSHIGVDSNFGWHFPISDSKYMLLC